MKYMLLMFAILSASFLMVGCAKTSYVCYDGTTQSSKAKCPTVPVPVVAQQEAGQAMDNYGNAVAQAKQDQYTRVNMYSQNGSWYANVLFTNSQASSIMKLLFKIDGKTADVACVTGCDYLTK